MRPKTIPVMKAYFWVVKTAKLTNISPPSSLISMIALNLRPSLQLTDEVFEQLCRSNPDLRLERNAQGDLVAMSPTGSESGYFNADINGQLWQWNRQRRLGFVFDSSTGFTLPNGAIRAPDAAWVEKTRWERLSPEQRRKFAPICPNFVIELKSPSDDLTTLQQKLQEYINNGTALGWLIVPEAQTVYRYQPGQSVESLDSPSTLSGAPVLSGFTLNLSVIWEGVTGI